MTVSNRPCCLQLDFPHQNLPENQCVFVRGFRVVRILNIWPRLRGQAGPAPSLHEHKPQSDKRLVPIGAFGDIDVRASYFFYNFFDVPKYQDPLHVLLRHIASVNTPTSFLRVHP